MAVCVHGTYEKNLESSLASGFSTDGMRRDVNVLIFLNIKKPLEDGIAFYINSDNKVILTEGIDSAVHVDYFQKIESWPNMLPVHL
ncbi:unnamed protein product [Brassica oleracea var. botrytis]|uniref:Uncharacterized protein n=1 Tax=Brassica oleracea TaxID=3712 RepID=A0A3P6CY51_BRAOL|nr:unnamed protein product [Brassica oleracea]